MTLKILILALICLIQNSCKDNATALSQVLDLINISRCEYGSNFVSFNWKNYNNISCEHNYTGSNIKINIPTGSNEANITESFNNTINDSDCNNSNEEICNLNKLLVNTDSAVIKICNINDNNSIFIHYDSISYPSNLNRSKTSTICKNEYNTYKSNNNLTICDNIIDFCKEYTNDVCTNCQNGYSLSNNKCNKDKFNFIDKYMYLKQFIIGTYLSMLILFLITLFARMYIYFPINCDGNNAHTFSLLSYFIDYSIYYYKTKYMKLNKNSLFKKAEIKCFAFIVSILLNIIILSIPLINMLYLIIYIYNSYYYYSEYIISYNKFKTNCKNPNVLNYNAVYTSRTKRKDSIDSEDIDLNNEINIDIDTRRKSHRTFREQKETVRINMNPNKNILELDEVRKLEVSNIFVLKNLNKYQIEDINIILSNMHAYINENAGFSNDEEDIESNKLYKISKSMEYRFYTILEYSESAMNELLTKLNLNKDNNTEESLGDLVIENNHVITHPVYVYWVQILDYIVVNVYFNSVEAFDKYKGVLVEKDD